MSDEAVKAHWKRQSLGCCKYTIEASASGVYVIKYRCEDSRELGYYFLWCSSTESCVSGQYDTSDRAIQAMTEEFLPI